LCPPPPKKKVTGFRSSYLRPTKLRAKLQGVLEYKFKRKAPVLEDRFTNFKVGKLTYRIVALIRV
jgi:hypothetical protein